MTAPAGVIFPIKFELHSTNQRLPSGPGVIPLGSFVTGYSVNVTWAEQTTAANNNSPTIRPLNIRGQAFLCSALLCSALLCSALLHQHRREFHENDSSVSVVDCLGWRRVKSIHPKSCKNPRKITAHSVVLPVRGFGVQSYVIRYV